MKQRILRLIKTETVLLLSFFLALLSVFFVHPDKEYLAYVDYRTIALLFCLMSVVAGLNGLGLFEKIAHTLLKRCKTLRILALVMTALCFFSSMLITNDVALITFVPLTLAALRLSNGKNHAIFIVVLETVAANLGSMLTPIGNPQNLFLYNFYHMDVGTFLLTVLPYAGLSLLMLVGACCFLPNSTMSYAEISAPDLPKTPLRYTMYAALFILALLSVFRVLPYYVTLIITLAALLILDRKALLRVDYSLLLTFVFLFVFIGNLGRIPVFFNFLQNIVDGREVIAGVLSSQIFSNVPAAILLSEFTQNAPALLLGVNLGGLGTLIASMASLISFRFAIKEQLPAGKYLLWFTVVNVLFLLINLLLWLII